MVLKKHKDHWAFLEEIEAPMWIDLTLEANCHSQDKNDDWFYTSHQFHQCSSCQLKSMFSCTGEETKTAELELPGVASPKLPSSVSRSRGKDFRSKDWEGVTRDASLNKQLPAKVLRGKPSWVRLGSREEIKHKLSFIHPKGTLSKKVSVTERNLDRNLAANHVKTISTSPGYENGSSSSDQAGVSKTLSTVTFESNQQQQEKPLEVSSQALSHTTGLLPAIKISLRKSYLTRQALRVEISSDRSCSVEDISNDRKKSKDRKSSCSSKSSTGSSLNSGYNTKSSTFMFMQSKEPNLESRNLARLTEAAKNKVKVPNRSKASVAPVKEGTHNFRSADLSKFEKSAHLQAAKPKARIRARPFLKPRVNEQNLSTGAMKAGEKVQGNRFYPLVGTGKENETGKTSTTKKGNGRDDVFKGMFRGQKTTKENMLPEGGRGS